MKTSAQPKPRRDWRLLLRGAALVGLVLLAYSRAPGGSFLWDDDDNVVKNLALRSWSGLWAIWFHPGATQQFYPLTHTSFWLDFHVWGLNPTGYHLENILLHASCVVLVWRILRGLNVPGCWLAAALFAVHPVCVETVAWITERKNTLSGAFFLASLLASVKFWLAENPASGSRPWKFYWLALALYVGALLSKTATVGLPVVIALLLWWQRRGPSRRDLALLAPFLVLGAGMSLITLWVEKNHLGACGEEWSFSLVQRCLIAARAFWFYLGKVIWPHPLMFIYPRWNIDASQPLAYVPLIALAALAVMLWRARESRGRPVLFAAGYFVAVLFPVLGFFNVFFYRYSFVSDHFVYLAAIAPLALVAWGIVAAGNAVEKSAPILKPVAFVVLPLALGVLTWLQTGVFQNMETLWRDAVWHNPNSWMAHDNLGKYLSLNNRFDEAKDQYDLAISLRPNDYVAWNDLGLDFARQGKLDDAIRSYTKALEIKPNYGLAHYNLGNTLARKKDYAGAIDQLRQAVELEPAFAPGFYSLGNALADNRDLTNAIPAYNRALQIDPNFAPAHYRLGRAFEGKGSFDDAIDQYREALRIDPHSVDTLLNLGGVLIERQHYEQAIDCYRRAIDEAPKLLSARVAMGIALAAIGRLSEATDSLRAALALDPNVPVTHYYLGLALARQGKRDEARTQFTEAIRLRPGYADAERELHALDRTPGSTPGSNK